MLGFGTCHGAEKQHELDGWLERKRPFLSTAKGTSKR